MILGGAATAAVILTAWLPVGALIAQHSALSAASSRLSQLSAEGVALTAEEARLQTPAVIDQLAREQYQLVEPGQRLVQVLTPSFRPTSQRADGGPFPGDPGYAPVVDPADATSGPGPRRRAASRTGVPLEGAEHARVLALTEGHPAHRADVDAVTALLGRRPLGAFEVVVRRPDGAPVVIENSPWLDDGTPMPTSLWLVDPDLVRQVSALEASGGVRRLERAVDPDALAATHAAYAARRDARCDDRRGPRPTGGVGGTRTGVKCLHAHLANHLCGNEDPVGALVARELSLGALVPPPPSRDRLGA